MISNQEEKNKRLLMELFQLKKTTYYGPLLLKLACGVNFSNLATVRFFLKCGVDPNSGDPYGNGPLHDLLQCNRMIREWDLYKRDDYAIVRLLLDFGGRLDRENNYGLTPLDLWTAQNQFNTSGQHPLGGLPDWCYIKVPRLKVLSSRVVRAHDIPYSEETLPPTLCKFVKNHEMQ